MLKPPKIQSTKLLYEGYVSLREDLLEKEEGVTQSIHTVLCKDAIVILAQDPFGRWILNREYRHATKSIMLGCPGGVLEEGEDPITGGKRELLEETGYTSNEVSILGHCFPLPGLCNQKIYHLFAQNATKSREPNLDPFEFIETELVEDLELKRRILNPHNIDGNLLTALSFLCLQKSLF